MEWGIFFKDDYYYVINYYIVCMIYSGDPYLASSDVVKIMYFGTIIVYIASKTRVLYRSGRRNAVSPADLACK